MRMLLMFDVGCKGFRHFWEWMYSVLYRIIRGMVIARRLGQIHLASKLAVPYLGNLQCANISL